MERKGIRIFSLVGFEIRLDPSWVIILFLVIWSLSENFFPYHYKGLTKSTYWLMGISGALGLFSSIIFHELCHSLVARKFALPIKGITLFIFGGIAEMEREPATPKAEFFMAIAGPLSSIGLSLLFLGAYFNLPQNSASIPVIGVLKYLRWVNVLLAGFNLLPAFPLDGGRVFRSLLWQWNGNLRKATYISTRLGAGFGILISMAGILFLFTGDVIAGIWAILIGMFLHNASQLSYQRVLLKRVFEREPVRRFMNPRPITASPSMTIEYLVENLMYAYHFKSFPVINEQTLVGCIAGKNIKELPRSQWREHTVAEYMEPCSFENTVTPDTDVMKALAIMSNSGNSRVLVVEKDVLVGILTLKDLLHFLALKMSLEREEKEE